MGHRILIVDDNYDGADSLAMLLEEVGHETHKAHDGVEALDVAERVRPDAVLLDIGLPKLNGYEVCQRIRERPWGEELVIVALTGWGQEEDRQRSLDAGFDTHLVKPVDHERPDEAARFPALPRRRRQAARGAITVAGVSRSRAMALTWKASVRCRARAAADRSIPAPSGRCTDLHRRPGVRRRR